mgnify:CR=1 FL=1
MQLNEIRYDSAVPVEGYGPGFFRVGGEVIEGAMIATAERAAGWGGLDDLAPLEALAGQADVLFLGMGADIAHAPASLRSTRPPARRKLSGSLRFSICAAIRST